MDKVKVTFESEDGKKAIIDVEIDRDENTISAKCEFDPPINNNKTEAEAYEGLAMLFIRRILN